MKLLDFGAGDELTVRSNWLDSGIAWRQIVEKTFSFIGRESIGELEVHCLDLPKNCLQKEIKRPGHATIYGHINIDTVPDNVDLVCALHPDPQIMTNPSEYHRDLGIIIATKLKVGGLIIVQFDRCFSDETYYENVNNPKTNVFLEKMRSESLSQIKPIYETHKVGDMFPGVYDGLVLHAFIKQS